MYHVDVAELERTLSSLLVGTDPFEANAISDRIDKSFPRADNLYDKTSLIVCGIDIALWDLRTKLLGVNLSTLLGGRVRDGIPIAYPIFRQQSEEDIEDNLATVARVLDDGFHRFRVYVGRDLALDEAFLNRCRERFGTLIEIKSLDFSNLLDAHAAARFIERTRHLAYDFVEAPAKAGDLDGLRRVRRLIRVSEHAYSPHAALRMVSHGAVDILNVGLFVLGGITAARQVLAIAESAGVDCLIGTTQELAIGTAAAAHVGVSSTSVKTASDPVGPLLYGRDVVPAPLDFHDGMLFPPDGPGLGVEIDPDLLAAARDRLTWPMVDTQTVIDRTTGRHL
jgi:muconate cycloisomerase